MTLTGETSKKVLIVGGDSRIGACAAALFRRYGYVTQATTRRIALVDANRPFLDLENIQEFSPDPDLTHVVVSAAETNYERCEFSLEARKVNTEGIPALVNVLMTRNVSVTVLSSNTVFGGHIAYPNEDCKVAPRFPYAEQKSVCEARCIQAAENLGTGHLLSIVRLSKVISTDVEPLPTWLDSWRQGKVVRPYRDYILSPISPDFVAQALLAIENRRESGLFHLSGAEDISYALFARQVANKLGIKTAQIKPILSNQRLPFLAPHSGLGMERTQRLLGIEPQCLESLLCELHLDISDP